MDRRSFLATGLAAIFAGKVAPSFVDGAPISLYGNGNEAIYSGWLQDSTVDFKRRAKIANIHQFNHALRGTGKGKVVLLYKYFEKVTGKPLEPHSQQIGDCVGHAWCLGVDVLTAVRIALFNKPERWVAKSATEIVYAGARIEAGGGELKGDGARVDWAAKWSKDWGILLRRSYLNGAYDFTSYSGQKAREMGKRGGEGVPAALEPLAKLHPVKTFAYVISWEDCRDAIANGYPVVVGSSTGFNTRRDRYGFLRRTRRPWYHAMVILGIDDKFRRPGALFENSWGSSWVSGYTRHDQPAGSFWVDASTVDSMLKRGDSIALSGYVGYPRINIYDYRLW